MFYRSLELRRGAHTSTTLIALSVLAGYGCGHAPKPTPRGDARVPVSATPAVREAAEAKVGPPAPAAQPVEAKPADAPREREKEVVTKRSASPARTLAEGDDLQLDGLLAAPSPNAARGDYGLRHMAQGVASVGHGALGKQKSGAGGRVVLATPPPQDFNTEAYAHHADNLFMNVSDSPLSTFSVDVDTASYSNVRRFLRDGSRPPVDAVRIEEMVNYFRYGYAAPTGDAPFAVTTEVASAPWSPRHRLVQIGLRARDIESSAVPARNLVFLIDVSGSMESPDKLPLLKRGLSMLARQLRPQDRIAMVVYAGASGLALPSTPGDQQSAILSALAALEAGGSTNGADGIELAYRIAQEHFVQGGINRVILATDGDFNVGVTSEGELVRLIEQKRKSGVFLTVLGFGTGNLKDSTMESLADKGNGHYAYIDSIAEADKVLVREAGSTLYTVAKDVKLQLEWNPARVASYRLIGYENRVLADRDFNDDKKDAGDMGAGHTVTALYEIELARGAKTAPEVDPLKYQAPRAPTAAAQSDDLFTVKLRYKQPSSEQSALLSYAVKDGGRTLDQSSADFRWAAAVAGFGMLLRSSEARGELSLPLVQKLARSAVGEDKSGDRKELLELLDRAAHLGVGG